VEALAASPLRNRLFVVYAMWADETPSLRDAIAPYVDRVVLCEKPARSGSCHRNYQAYATHQGLRELERNGITWALKTRSDLRLSDRFLELVLRRAETPGYHRVLVTNLFTRYEPFHISDIVVFSSTPNMLHWFNPAPVFYEDMFSPEVQFARLFIRGRKLAYPMTLVSYLRFLRDWIELVDFYEEGLFWFKNDHTSIRAHNRVNFVIYDREPGPVLTRLITVRFHQSLEKKVKGLNLMATRMMVSDAIQRYIFTVLPWFRYQHCGYTVDNQGKEHDKAVPTNDLPTAVVVPTVTSLPHVGRNGNIHHIASSREDVREARQR
jgi:hypothetical protein